MRKAVFAVCLLNLIFRIGVVLFSLGSFGILGAFGAWSVIMALMLVLLSYSSWKDEEVLLEIADQIDRSSPSPEEKEITGLREKAMDSIIQNIDDPHHEKTIKLVNSYRKEGYIRPELVLENRLKEKMVTGLTMEQAIDELYTERGLNV